ncbi:MAG TPA: DNA internalization-related competence protein ComEC/Rec2 [Usitatibacter sp.]|jgi:competence protein ComEC|nr:DNA internalization-related competence protein ComEC/Rec2 [Usitatibacter sp.]
MRLFALAFLCGTWLTQQRAALPPFAWLALVAALVGVLACARARDSPQRWVALAAFAVAAGFAHAAWRAELRLDDALPRAWEGRDVRVTGVVDDLPQEAQGFTRFSFRVEASSGPVPREISIAWYETRGEEGTVPAIRAGERWRFTLRLKRPRGLANPHGFDFEAWSLERGIRATGYVRAQSPLALVDERVDGWPQSLHRARQAIRDRMQAALEGDRLGGVLMALAIGDQDAIGAEDWQVFWRTGVGHLMSISGLHITMLGALAAAIARWMWVRVPALPLAWPARKAAVVAGVLAALAYSLLTGYAVPAQRTFFMLATVAACILAERHGSPSRVLALAAVVVCIIDPWAVLAPGFWLSFGAVASIFYALSLRTGRPGPVRSAIGEQLAVTVLMLPMLLALFQQFSLVSPLANAFAIPLVSLVVVPLTLAGAFLDLAFLLHAAHAVMLGVMWALERLAAWEGATLETHEPAAWTVVLAVAGAAWLLAPRGVPLRGLGAVWIAPLFAVVPPRPPPGAAWIDVLEVGNGLAVAVRTATHAMVFDTGPRWSEDSDSGSRIVVPFLRGEGVRAIDVLLVSHADDDHSGGARSIAAWRMPRWFISSLPADNPLQASGSARRSCAAGDAWRWDGVDFRLAHPAATIYSETTRRKENDRSCVLRIATAASSALITGDAEARAELEMIGRGEPLRSDVLVIPHHGSKTSSTARFIEAVSPGVGVLSVGYMNRFHHPNAGVVARYVAHHVGLERTDERGALHIVLPASGAGAPEVTGQEAACRYWSERGSCYGR